MPYDHMCYQSTVRLNETNCLGLRVRVKLLPLKGLWLNCTLKMFLPYKIILNKMLPNLMDGWMDDLILGVTEVKGLKLVVRGHEWSLKKLTLAGEKVGYLVRHPSWMLSCHVMKRNNHKAITNKHDQKWYD